MRRRAAFAVAGLLLVVASIWAVPAPAYACSCRYADDDPALVDLADVIFTGNVVGERKVGHSRTYTFAVTKVYKGSVYAEQRVQTSAQGPACGLDLDGSGPFLVFGDYAPSGVLLANSCGGTTDAPAPAAFGPGSPPQPGIEPSTERAVTWPAVAGLLVLTAAVLLLVWRGLSARPKG